MYSYLSEEFQINRKNNFLSYQTPVTLGQKFRCIRALKTIADIFLIAHFNVRRTVQIFVLFSESLKSVTNAVVKIIQFKYNGYEYTDI